MTTSLTRKVLTNPIYFLGFGFGVGLSRFAPGTLGTLIAVPFYLLLQYLSWPLYLAITLIAFFVGIWICHVTEKMVGIPDYSGIVWDEMVGFWVTMFLAPSKLQWIIIGFVLFRVFDILKPWPISWVNKNVHGGFGVMVDDLLAALVSFGILQFIIWGASYI